MFRKVIETRYKGYRFRSRLEARWAVYLDTLGWLWEYEPEGFEFKDGTRYLPDFLIVGHCDRPGCGREESMWLEIKPKPFTLVEKHKAWLLADATLKEIGIVGLGVGLPPEDGFIPFFVGGDGVEPHSGGQTDVMRDPTGKLLDIISDSVAWMHDYREQGRPYWDTTLTSWMEEPRSEIVAAARRAKGARFEFGEQG